MEPDKTQFNVPKGDGININRDVDTPRKPEAIPKGERDFKRVYRERDDRREKRHQRVDDKEEHEETAGGEEETAVEKKPASIFDLSGKVEKKETHKDKIVPIKEKVHEEAETTVYDPTPAKKDKPRDDVYAREQPDLSSVNLLSGAGKEQVAGVNVAKADLPPTTSKDLQELITQLVEKVTTMETKGQTDTTLTLKHPPLFAGVEIKLSSFETARGEFNIMFSNLTSQAKNVLDLNLNTLRQGLEQKGHLIHIVTTTTQVEAPKETEGELFARGEREGSEDKEQDKRDKEG